MSKAAERTHPELWEEVKAEVKESEKGGKAGEWSARKAQLAVQEYKKRGGGYRGRAASGTATYAEASPSEQGDARQAKELPRRPPQAIRVESYRDTRRSAPEGELTKSDLLEQAKMLEIGGRSRMNKDALARAIRYAKH